MNCPICQNNVNTLIYNDKIRAGKFGVFTNEKFSILHCVNCGIHFLNPVPIVDDFYESEQYRKDYNITLEKQKYWDIAINENELRISRMGIKTFVDKSVIDVGVGPGMFLDIIHGVAKETIAVEPAKFFHEELAKKHRVYSYTSDVVSDQKKGDVVLSFNVIEHVPHPIDFLKELYEITNNNGTLFLMTPNHDDILMELIPEVFQPFYYRTAHLYYFDAKSIAYCLEQAGFQEYKINYMHTMDVSNLLIWLKDHKPTGIGKFAFFDHGFDDLYRHYLEQHGKANYLWIEAKR